MEYKCLKCGTTYLFIDKVGTELFECECDVCGYVELIYEGEQRQIKNKGEEEDA